MTPGHGPRRCDPRAPLASALLVACGLGAACGPGALEAFDVTVVTTLQCTRNASSQQCDDPDVLAQQRVLARWTFEHAVNAGFTLVASACLATIRSLSYARPRGGQ